MSKATRQYDGHLISELGVKRYLLGYSSQQYSNINLFHSVKDHKGRWKDKACLSGCHGGSYRTLRRKSTWNDAMKSLSDTSPVAAGFVDGVKFGTVDTVSKLGAGVERTAEGLHVLGAEKFTLVGDENWAVANLVQTTYTALINSAINVMDNPIMKCTTVIIDRYLTAVPEWVIEDLLVQGALEFPDGFDKHQFLLAAKQKAVNLASLEQVDKASNAINDFKNQFLAKQVGKALTAKTISAISSAIATNIAKNILSHNVTNMRIKRDLASIRKLARSAKGGLGGALVGLLKAQGFLGHAAKASRQLRKDCPKTWNVLRYDMQGADMVFVFVQPMIAEYVDRLSLLEKEPLKFARVMEALIRDRETKKILLP
ncbi:hypothetical protein MNBD_GAMMA11-2629 [hydrothermal vent metagenome]|uniref:Uncharacterized protein n=1 Tax=hydrothermal vent metagenome TaxID=652676 RepID=A0A3B0X4D3_9ZZZZ